MCNVRMFAVAKYKLVEGLSDCPRCTKKEDNKLKSVRSKSLYLRIKHNGNGCKMCSLGVRCVGVLDCTEKMARPNELAHIRKR